jgi:hypothetical protein
VIKLPREMVIEINTDKKCSKCGQSGATQSGLCLTCITDTIKVNPFLKGLYKIPGSIGDLIGMHVKDLEEAWANCGDSEPLTISFSVKMGMKDSRGVTEVGISFTKEKVKDSCQTEWDPKQMSLIK